MSEQTQPMDEQSRIKEAILRLEPQEAVIFKLLLHLRGLEKLARDPDVPHAELNFQGGRTVDQIIESVLRGNTVPLPVPRGPNYDSFGWQMIYPRTNRRAEMKALGGYGAYQNKYPTRGSADIRVYQAKEPAQSGIAEGLIFHANIDDFRGMERDWSAALDPIPYPCKVQDTVGFSLVNAHWQNLTGKR